MKFPGENVSVRRGFWLAILGQLCTGSEENWGHELGLEQKNNDRDEPYFVQPVIQTS